MTQPELIAHLIAKVEERLMGPGEFPGFKDQDYCHVCGNNVRLGCLPQCAWAKIKALLQADGWKLVPVIPTVKMVEALADNWLSHVYTIEASKTAYHAMIAAAPKEVTTPYAVKYDYAVKADTKGATPFADYRYVPAPRPDFLLKPTHRHAEGGLYRVVNDIRDVSVHVGPNKWEKAVEYTDGKKYYIRGESDFAARFTEINE